MASFGRYSAPTLGYTIKRKRQHAFLTILFLSGCILLGSNVAWAQGPSLTVAQGTNVTTSQQLTFIAQSPPGQPLTYDGCATGTKDPQGAIRWMVDGVAVEATSAGLSISNPVNTAPGCNLTEVVAWDESTLVITFGAAGTHTVNAAIAPNVDPYAQFSETLSINVTADASNPPSQCLATGSQCTYTPGQPGIVDECCTGACQSNGKCGESPGAGGPPSGSNPPPPCISDDDCPGGLVCANGICGCVDPCDDPSCLGYSADNCGNCGTDDDCPGGLVCQAGFCGCSSPCDDPSCEGYDADNCNPPPPDCSDPCDTSCPTYDYCDCDPISCDPCFDSCDPLCGTDECDCDPTQC